MLGSSSLRQSSFHHQSSTNDVNLPRIPSLLIQLHHQSNPSSQPLILPSLQELLGPFTAVSRASLKLVPEAFDGRFPVQVKCRLSGEKLIKLQESEFKSIIKENYYNRHKFSFCLTHRQVRDLDGIAIGVLGQWSAHFDVRITIDSKSKTTRFRNE